MLQELNQAVVAAQNIYRTHKPTGTKYTICSTISKLPHGGGYYAYVKTGKSEPTPMIFCDELINKLSEEYRNLFFKMRTNTTFVADTFQKGTRLICKNDDGLLNDVNLHAAIKLYLRGYALSGISAKKISKQVAYDILRLIDKSEYSEDQMVSIDELDKIGDEIRVNVIKELFSKGLDIRISYAELCPDE